MTTLIETSFRRAIEAAEDGNGDARVTLETHGEPHTWLQLSYDTINAAYPLAEEPTNVLTALSITLPEYVEVSAWEAHKFVTFEHGAEPLPDLVRFVQDYTAKVLHIAEPDTVFRVVEESGQ